MEADKPYAADGSDGRKLAASLPLDLVRLRTKI